MSSPSSEVEGELVALGVGKEHGDGTCTEYWVLDEVEVSQGTEGAARRWRGGEGELQLRLSDGRAIWYSAHHCCPVQVAVPTAAPEPSSAAAESSTAATPVAKIGQ